MSDKWLELPTHFCPTQTISEDSVADPDQYGMFLGLPDPDVLVRGTDPDPGPFIINRKK
jgi:hypothetical protein